MTSFGEISRMKLLEYKAKELFERVGMPTAKGAVLSDANELESLVEEHGLCFPLVIKAQVQVGGRGKAGGIRFADDVEQAKRHCANLLGSQLKGFAVNQLLVVEKASHTIEWYLSIMLDRLNKCPVIIFSPKGGVDIEETATENPKAIKKLLVDPDVGIRPYMARYLLSSCGISLDLCGQFSDILGKLYTVFTEYNCLLSEINPLVVDEKGGVIALDGKVDIDDSSLYRLPDLLAFRDSLQEEELVLKARKSNFLYIPVEDSGSIAVSSNGSGMLMSCIDLISKENMKVRAALDLGGGATAERVSEAISIIFETQGVKALLLNIFGGITRCDEIAHGIEFAMPKLPEDAILIVRMEGTNKEEGLKILESMRNRVVSVPGLRESVAALLERRAAL